MLILLVSIPPFILREVPYGDDYQTYAPKTNSYKSLIVGTSRFLIMHKPIGFIYRDI